MSPYAFKVVMSRPRAHERYTELILGHSTTFRHFFPKMYTLISHFSFKFGSCGYRRTRFQLRRYRLNLLSGFWVMASGCLAMSAWRVFPEEKLEYFFKEKKQINDIFKQTINHRVQFYIYFVSKNDLDHVTSTSSFLWSRVTRLHL